MKPVKLVRGATASLVKTEEISFIEDMPKLNELYALKIQEELLEIQAANHKDVKEFADLLQVVTDFAIANNFGIIELLKTVHEKKMEKGFFTNMVLNNLNPANPSNKLYFDRAEKDEQDKIGRENLVKEMQDMHKDRRHTTFDTGKMYIGGQTIILCTGDNEDNRFKGTVVCQGDPTSDHAVGNYSESWVKNSFEEFNGRPVVLNNAKWEPRKEIGTCQG